MKKFEKFDINSLDSISYNELFDNRNEIVMNVKQTSKFLGVSEKLVYKKTREGILPHSKELGRYIYLRSELIKFLKGG